MTSIGGFLSSLGLAAQKSLPKLAVGEAIQVRVLGATRNGLSVLIGRQSFQLDGPSNLADARTLTLQGAPSPSSERKVQIIALDDRPLSTPVPATLTSRSQATPPAESAIVQRSQLQVVAQLVDAGGQALGRALTINLQAERPAAGAMAVAGSAPNPVTNTKPEAPETASRQGIELTRHGMLSSALSSPPKTDVAGGRAPGVDVTRPARSGDGASPGNGSPPGQSPASMKPADVRLSVINGSVGETHQKANLSQPGQTSAMPLPLIGGEARQPKSTVVSAVSTYRTSLTSGSQAPSSLPSQPLPTTERQAAPESAQPDASRTMKAVVIARTDVGQIILKAADQHFRIEQPIDLPIGTTLQASLVAGASVMPSSLVHGLSDGQASPIVRLITLLDSIDQASRQSDLPDTSDLKRQLPAPDKFLASRLLGLLTAGTDQQAQSAERPLPDQGALTTTSKDQIQTLVRDLAATASEPLTEGWKSLTLPIGQDQAQAVCCYFRHNEFDPDEEGSDGGDDRREDAERAIFDVSLSQLGRCQIDALCQERRFDLLIRTEERLSEADRQDIASLFLSASEIAGMNGDIGFKVGGFFEPVRWSAAPKDFRT